MKCVARWLVPALLFAVGSCGNGGESVPGAPVGFVVTQVVPNDLAQNIPLTEEVNVVCSRAVNEASARALGAVEVRAESGDLIFGDISVSPLSPTIIRFVPGQAYFPFAVHTIRVTTAVRDRDGTPLDRDYEFRFQTEEAGPVFPDDTQIDDFGDLLSTGRWSHRMTLLDSGRILVAGGYAANNTPTAVAEQIFPNSDQIFLFPNGLVTARAAHVQVKLADGRVLLAGGESSSEPFLPLRDCEIFHPGALTFTQVAPMAIARSFAHGVLLADGRVLVSGGQGDGVSLLMDAEIYDPDDDSWSPVPGQMADWRSGHFSATLFNGDVLFIGGNIDNVDSDRWVAADGEFATPTLETRFAHFFGAGTTLADGRPVVFGGVESLGVTIWDFDIGFVNALNTMQDERSFATATALPDGRAVIVGGFDTGASLIHATVDLFFPIGKTGRIFRIPDFTLPAPTSHHAAVLDPEGNLWITGGLPSDLKTPGLQQVTHLRLGEEK